MDLISKGRDKRRKETKKEKVSVNKRRKKRKKGENKKKMGKKSEAKIPISYATGSGKPFAASGTPGDLT